MLSIAVLVLAAPAGAQPSGIISGLVLDATMQAPLAGAVITARGPALMGEQTAVTDDAGAFEITMLPPGTYALAVQHDGFLPFSPEGLVVKSRRMKVRLAGTVQASLTAETTSSRSGRTRASSVTHR